QGVSYVLFTNGVVDEYRDATATWTYVYNNASTISAGTDKLGVNAVDIIFTWGDAWEYSDSSGWHFIASCVASVSAGQRGLADFVTTAGKPSGFTGATGATVFLTSNVAQITAGTDQYGNYMIDLLYTSGSLSEYKVGSGWTTLTSGLKSISKARAGLLDVLFSSGYAYEHD